MKRKVGKTRITLSVSIEQFGAVKPLEWINYITAQLNKRLVVEEGEADADVAVKLTSITKIYN